MQDQLIHSFEKELSSILNYWSKYAIDKHFGGFLGAVDNQNNSIKEAPKGSVLNARILWSFSAGYNFNQNKEYLEIAHKSFSYIKQYFIDEEYGGVYWSVDYAGKPLDTKKQIYALSFTIYGLTEYFKATLDKRALELSISLYQTIEKYSYDDENEGYIEALNRNWQTIDDFRLSEKDVNEKKTMNTHLHILEAYTNLYRFWPYNKLKQQIENLLNVFSNHIIDKHTKHLILFFNENWQTNHNIFSYGHDIEASWLLLEAAEVINNNSLIKKFKKLALDMTIAASEGLDARGGMNYEFNLNNNHKINEKHWWVQAEAMVGFLNAYQLTNNQLYYHHFLAVWGFTQKHIIDNEKGEWFWGVKEDFSLMDGEDKVGFWKCPYHNSRACIEIIHRLKSLSS